MEQQNKQMKATAYDNFHTKLIVCLHSEQHEEIQSKLLWIYARKWMYPLKT